VLKVLVAENIFKLLVVSVFSLTFDVEVALIAIVLAIELI
jgi:predicted lysophospholipase L1 biosynthesis ABC-type transport system permease subunit